MAKNKSSLAEGVAARLLAVPLRWWQQLPEDTQAELEQVRQQYLAGDIKAAPYRIAAALIAEGKARGWKMPSDKLVVRWLRENR